MNANKDSSQYKLAKINGRFTQSNDSNEDFDGALRCL